MIKRITTDKKLLFLGVNFQLENSFTKRRLDSGYVAYSIN